MDAADVAAYRALLPAALTAAELAQRLGTSIDAVEGILHRLQGLRLVHPSPIDPGAYEAVSPDLAAAELVAHFESHAQALVYQATTVRREFGALSPLYHEARRERLRQGESEVLTDSGGVRRRLQELAINTRRSVLAAHPTIAPPEVLAAGLALDEPLLARGVSYRVIFPHVALRQKHGRDHIAALRALGADVRTAALIQTRILVLDGETAVIPVEPDRGAGAAIITDPSVIGFLKEIFEQVWDRARPVERDSLAKDLFDEVEMEILTELSRGRTDEAVARRLGVSTRTVRRYLTSLSERFGAESRFQLGMAAYAAGLLPLDEERLSG